MMFRVNVMQSRMLRKLGPKLKFANLFRCMLNKYNLEVKWCQTPLFVSMMNQLKMTKLVTLRSVVGWIYKVSARNFGQPEATCNWGQPLKGTRQVFS